MHTSALFSTLCAREYEQRFLIATRYFNYLVGIRGMKVESMI